LLYKYYALYLQAYTGTQQRDSDADDLAATSGATAYVRYTQKPCATV